MKRKRDATTEFRVPLSSEALKVIEQVCYFSKSDFILSVTGHGPLGGSNILQHMKHVRLEARPHGFRSSLRDWLAETTDAPL